MSKYYVAIYMDDYMGDRYYDYSIHKLKSGSSNMKKRPYEIYYEIDTLVRAIEDLEDEILSADEFDCVIHEKRLWEALKKGLRAWRSHQRLIKD